MKSFEEFAKDYGCLPYREIKELYEAYKQGVRDVVMEYQNISDMDEADSLMNSYYTDICHGRI
jgi:hypothetical protein